MQSFAYERAVTLPTALAALADRSVMPIAGGTEIVNWMKEGIAAPSALIDISTIPSLDHIDIEARGLTIGALARMSDVARHEGVARDYPAIAEALVKSASQQIRNMATIGGNLMQRNRCPYFRAETELACNRRKAGSGCSALLGEDRFAVIFGRSAACIAPHASDLAVALAAFDTEIEVKSLAGPRRIAFADFYGPLGETALQPGEIITAIHVRASAPARQSSYLKIRERRSYEFALVSVAAGLTVKDGRINDIRLALGGVASKPWRLHHAEKALIGAAPADAARVRQALAQDFAMAQPGRHNGFKTELAQRAVIKAIQKLGDKI